EAGGGCIKQAECSEMTWHHRFEPEKALASQCSHRAAHCEAVTDRHQADIWCMQLVDERHSGENVRVAHVIQRLVIGKVQHQSMRVPEIDVAVLHRKTGRMRSVDKGRGESTAIDGPTMITHVEFFGPLFSKKIADF